jgi:hypothetical protein
MRGEPPPEGTRLSFWGGELLNGETFDAVDKLAAFAEERGHSLHELAARGARVDAGHLPPYSSARPRRRDELDAIPRVEGGGVHTGPPRR